MYYSDVVHSCFRTFYSFVIPTSYFCRIFFITSDCTVINTLDHNYSVSVLAVVFKSKGEPMINVYSLTGSNISTVKVSGFTYIKNAPNCAY